MSNKNEKIILFDGVCVLCNSFLQFVLFADTKNIFKFATLQSSFGHFFLTKNNLNTDTFDSFILITKTEDKIIFYTKSTAFLMIMNALGGFWRLSLVFFIIPKFIRDYFYNIVVKNRYKWFGKTECSLPTDELKTKIATFYT